ncbi:8034_t:CDS:2 [Dentiscutata erythropus]|uniref:8034_t:CDS:1 n=1 Tax=Dentiscutata erythropus TaxID=1348616 RepID=A0A9N9BC97_9GLOM|nr:8034_t:CDS:2 [Dentiscutata erythropus]
MSLRRMSRYQTNTVRVEQVNVRGILLNYKDFHGESEEQRLSRRK